MTLSSYFPRSRSQVKVQCHSLEKLPFLAKSESEIGKNRDGAVRAEMADGDGKETCNEAAENLWSAESVAKVVGATSSEDSPVLFCIETRRQMLCDIDVSN